MSALKNDTTSVLHSDPLNDTFDGLSSDLVKYMMPGKPPGECFDLIKIWIFVIRKQAAVLSGMLSFSAAAS